MIILNSRNLASIKEIQQLNHLQWAHQSGLAWQTQREFVSKKGKYDGGTFAYPDIALEFASWIDPAFKLYLIQEFERLKYKESYQNGIEWTVRRSLSKANYIIHTGSIKENLLPTLTKEQKRFVYANEADVINVALFGITAKE